MKGADFFLCYLIVEYNQPLVERPDTARYF